MKILDHQAANFLNGACICWRHLGVWSFCCCMHVFLFHLTWRQQSWNCWLFCEIIRVKKWLYCFVGLFMIVSTAKIYIALKSNGMMLGSLCWSGNGCGSIIKCVPELRKTYSWSEPETPLHIQSRRYTSMFEHIKLSYYECWIEGGCFDDDDIWMPVDSSMTVRVRLRKNLVQESAMCIFKSWGEVL